MNEMDIIRKIKPVTFCSKLSTVTTSDESTLPIFVMWWQGESQMPVLVKACYENLLSKAGNHPVHLITQNNFQEYIKPGLITWDNRIMDYFKSGNLKFPQLADLVRSYITYNMGGVWIDATVWITADCLDNFVHFPFFSGKRDKSKVGNLYPSRGRWTSYFFATLKGAALSEFIYSNMLKLLIVDNTIKEYFTIDYLFNYAYHHCREVRGMVLSSKTLNNNFYSLDLNKPYSKSEFDSLSSNTPFYKFNYKLDYRINDSEGKLTYFGFLTKEIRSRT
jgi:hypothetical protein